MTPNPEMRIGDAEREAAAASLREHYAQGRLTLDELNERLDASFTAKTQSQLDTITADLPHAQAPWGQARQDIAPGPAPQVPQRPGGAGPIAAFVAGFFILALVLLTLHNARDGHAGSGLFLLIPALIILRVVLFRLFGRRRGWYQSHNHYHHHDHHHGDRGRAPGRDRRQSGGQQSDQRWSSGPGRGSDDSW